MILASHAVIGAAVSRLMPGNPYLGFLLAAASHFIADAVPHWDYAQNFRSVVRGEGGRFTDMRLGKDFLFDLSRIGADTVLGLLLSLLVFEAYARGDFITIIIGALGGIFPDGLQFLYLKTKKEPFVAIQKFHEWIHAKPAYNGRGVILQATAVVAAVFVSVWLRP